MIRREILASRETGIVAKKSSSGRVEIYGFFPIDRADCDCQKMIVKWKNDLSAMSSKRRSLVIKQAKFLECPKDKEKMNRYNITCKNCGEILGYCWATDETLTDWCDFHYVQWTDGNQWYGCFTPHISPITQELCLECCCGQDTRDFRANMTLSHRIATGIEKENSKGRSFGNKFSKFKIGIVNKGVITLKLKEG